MSGATSGLAVAMAGLAAALAVGPRPSLLARRLGAPAGQAARAPAGDAADGRPRPLGGAPWGLSILLAAAAVGAMALGAMGAVLGPVAVLALWFVRRRRSRAARRRAAAGEIAQACVALSAELNAGAPARDALAHVAADWPESFGAAAGRVATGGDPVPALRAVARLPGHGALTAVAAAFEVSERTGAGLSTLLIQVADALRAEAAVRREAEAQLATVRTTSRLLAVLPAGTLLLLSAGDAAPIRFLTGNPYGLLCSLAAAALVAAGLTWVDRMARRATRSVWER